MNSFVLEPSFYSWYGSAQGVDKDLNSISYYRITGRTLKMNPFYIYNVIMIHPFYFLYTYKIKSENRKQDKKKKTTLGTM